VKVIFNDLGGENYEEKISYVGSTINTDNRTFPVEIYIANKERKIKPELNAQVKIERVRYENVIVVPEEVVTRTDQGYVVFVEENGLAKMRVVNVAGRFANKAAISEGLNGGDNLIHVGYQKLIDGEKVRVLN
jgi:multidrug efflux pump subunit AcrA (membrane-fusion protein)